MYRSHKDYLESKYSKLLHFEFFNFEIKCILNVYLLYIKVRKKDFKMKTVSLFLVEKVI